MNQNVVKYHLDKVSKPCEHVWEDCGADVDYCWHRRCVHCGEIEGQRHTFVPADMVTGMCVRAFVCEGCGYVPG